MACHPAPSNPDNQSPTWLCSRWIASSGLRLLSPPLLVRSTALGGGGPSGGSAPTSPAGEARGELR